METGAPNIRDARKIASLGLARAHVMLVTVTEIETKAVRDTFCKNGPPTELCIDKRVYTDLGEVRGARVMMTQSEMGTSGVGASLQAVSKGIAALSPTVVIIVGIAFGVNKRKQRIGDVLVTKQLQPYELQRIGSGATETEKVILRGDKPHASDWLLSLTRISAASWVRSENTEVRFGTVLTGEKLIDNRKFRDELLKLVPDAIGGEMEGMGLYVACHDKHVDWILVKGICDFADGYKAANKEKNQERAAMNAADFVYHTLNAIQIEWAVQHDDQSLFTRRVGGGVNQEFRNELSRIRTAMLSASISGDGALRHCRYELQALLERYPNDAEGRMLLDQLEESITRQRVMQSHRSWRYAVLVALAAIATVLTAFLVVGSRYIGGSDTVVLENPPELPGRQGSGVGSNDSPFRCPDPMIIQTIVEQNHSDLQMHWEGIEPIKFTVSLGSAKGTVTIDNIETKRCRPKIVIDFSSGSLKERAAIEAALRTALQKGPVSP